MMTGFDDMLRELIDWHAGPDAAVLSLYLDVSGDGDAPLAFTDAILSLDLDDTADPSIAALSRMAHDMRAELSSEVAGARREGYAGLAVFLCANPRLERVIRLRFPFENQGLVGRDPFLRQLLFYAEEYEPAVCVMLDGPTGSLCEVHIGDLGRLRTLVPTHGRTLPEEVATTLFKLAHEDPRLHVILVGSPSDLAPVTAALAPEVRARLLDPIERPLSPHDPQFLPAVHRVLQGYERKAEALAVAELFAARERHEPVAVGLEETLDAINQGRIRTLYVLHRYTGRAWLCDACDRLGVLPAPPACLSCGASVSVVAAEEHLLDQAAACGAEIETVAESAALAEVGGVGARL